jgi:hypothetical protein
MATEDGALLVDLASNSYYSLNHTGYRAWCILSDGGTPEAAARALSDTWTVPPQSADTQVRQLIDELVAEALLVPFDHTSKS